MFVNIMIEICPYQNIDDFKKLLIENLLDKCPRFIPDTIEKKLHIPYFEEYLDKLNAKTILVECDYVDHDFLMDFSGYYVRCFEEYKRFCTRFHFFNNAFSETDFRGLLQNLDSPIRGEKPDKEIEILINSYLGFLVVKPLPETIIGRTCLKTYDHAEKRHFPVKREYPVNLFGIPLKVETLPFQEQDRTVAACATSALWSIFHGTGILFQHAISSPVEITKIASKPLGIRKTRILPNSGLYLEEMAQAIESVGLEPQLESATHEFLLKSTLYAYLRGKIPILLAFYLLEPPYDPAKEYTAGHAAAVMGYSLGIDKPQPFGEQEFLLRASRIDKICAHDDQIGPFARMGFIENKPSGFRNFDALFTTSWPDEERKVGNILAKPDSILIPLYEKIRIRFKSILASIIEFDSFLKEIQNPPSSLRFEWDIYLTTVNDFKSCFRGFILHNEFDKPSILLKRFPRFLWRATAYQGNEQDNEPVLDVIFDATDIEQGSNLFTVIEYKSILSTFLRTLFQDDEITKPAEGTAAWQVVEWFKKN